MPRRIGPGRPANLRRHRVGKPDGELFGHGLRWLGQRILGVTHAMHLAGALRRRKHLVGGVVASVLAMAATCGHAATAPPPLDSRQSVATEREVRIVNRGRHAIAEVYVSSSASEDWGDERLREAPIDPGRTQRLRLGRARECVVDVQVVYDDASREERHQVDACRDRPVIFDGSAATGAMADTHAVIVANESGRPIQQVLISPAAAGEWGEDLLGPDSLSVGDRASVIYRGGCRADLRVVFDNRSAEERRDLDLCALRGVAVRPGWTTADALAMLPENTGSGTEQRSK